jgi:hypothetical protein
MDLILQIINPHVVEKKNKNNSYRILVGKAGEKPSLYG